MPINTAMLEAIRMDSESLVVLELSGLCDEDVLRLRGQWLEIHMFRRLLVTHLN